MSGDILRTVTGYCSQKYQTGSIYVGETLQETETYQRSQQTVKMYEKYFSNFLKRKIDILKFGIYKWKINYAKSVVVVVGKLSVDRQINSFFAIKMLNPSPKLHQTLLFLYLSSD